MSLKKTASGLLCDDKEWGQESDFKAKLVYQEHLLDLKPPVQISLIIQDEAYCENQL